MGAIFLRAFCLLLCAVFVIPPGLGQFDLCTCEAGDHGLLCATPSAPTATPSSCCAAPTELAAERSTEECPGCPSLDLTEDLTLATPEQRAGSLRTTLAKPAVVELASVHETASPLTTSWPRPPPGKHRPHLVLSVFLL